MWDVGELGQDWDSPGGIYRIGHFKMTLSGTSIVLKVCFRLNLLEEEEE